MSKWSVLWEKDPYRAAITGLVERIPKQKNFSALNIAMTLNALSKRSLKFIQENTLQIATSFLFRDFAEALQKHKAETSIYHDMKVLIPVLILAWCLFDFQCKRDQRDGIASFPEEELVSTLMNEYQKEIINDLKEANAWQLYQILLYKKSLLANDQLIHLIFIKLKSLPECETIFSSLQADVTDYVQNLYPKIHWEVKSFIGFISVDMVCHEKKLIIKVYGPSHYERQNLNLSTQFHDYLLQKAGWTVITIPYFEWDGLSTLEEKKSYMNTQLKDSCLPAAGVSKKGLQLSRLFAQLDSTNDDKCLQESQYAAMNIR